MLGRLLNRIFPGLPPKGQAPVPWSPLAPPMIPKTPALTPKQRGWLDSHNPPSEPPPLTPRDAELARFASALDAVSRRGYERLYNAAPVSLPGNDDRAELRNHALRDVHDRVAFFCLGEVQNQRPALALEYRKAFDVFNALWKIMVSINPQDIKKRR